MSSDVAFERELTRAEIAQRKDDCFDLLTERDGVLAAIDERKRAIKTLSLESASLDARISVLRHEVRSGKTLVTRQQVLPLDGPVLGDSNGKPVADPRDYCPDCGEFLGILAVGKSGHECPMAGQPEALSPFDLRQVIVAVLPKVKLLVPEVESWHPDVRADVQGWCRAELAWAHPIAGQPLRPRGPMPNVLQALMAPPAKKKRASKKRRSGSTANSD